ncbi:hypothetical protein IW261DRAFT_1413127 [Armillaria novae-zelandiae]|uniref:Uncharacterized protein n=1 Tax=Armillaria novae-zelandiae TaxID=153914 RepID=A0AA39UNM7_9AGAR|nr:hypothetical protein IW261DRAFT_1413127 [Armillaria novae-zelandiae]
MKKAECENPDDLSATRPSVWKITKVHVRGRPRSQSGWIAYHESEDPLSLVERSRYVGYNSKSPSVSFVNRYGWGYHMLDLENIPRRCGDINPDSGWKALLEHEHRRKRVHKVVCSSALEDLGTNHPDAARAKRRGYYQLNKIFLLDTDKAPGLVKFLARETEMIAFWYDVDMYGEYDEDEPACEGGCVLRPRLKEHITKQRQQRKRAKVPTEYAYFSWDTFP